MAKADIGSENENIWQRLKLAKAVEDTSRDLLILAKQGSNNVSLYKDQLLLAASNYRVAVSKLEEYDKDDA